MPFLGFGKSREVTVVSDETERQIPLRTYWNCAGVTILDILLVILDLFLLARQVHNLNHLPRVGNSWIANAWEIVLTWWPTIVIFCTIGPIVWSVPLLYRFYVETVGKNAMPMPTEWPSEKGMWTLFSGKEKKKSRYREFYGNDRN